ncbi:hypothetical protein AYI69_g9534 [Smittium culicis]|uniref:Uncharacterized protein n=1 Tax=Smittium culicis TaxID=133412 RepID=A0A1R1XBZ1_9FUNG|nr:hypothetical protein AYI69_g10095 [Smittium culicis]OMJ12149.1 hypothetical protein AYI69_g9534 [Smittium culicis]
MKYIKHGVNQFYLAPVDIDKILIDKDKYYLVPINLDIIEINFDKPIRNFTPNLLGNSDKPKEGEIVGGDEEGEKADEEASADEQIEKEELVSGGIKESEFKESVHKAKCAFIQSSEEIYSAIKKYRVYFPKSIITKEKIRYGSYTNGIFDGNKYHFYEGGSFKDKQQLMNLSHVGSPIKEGIKEFSKIEELIVELYSKMVSEYKTIRTYVDNITDKKSGWYIGSQQLSRIITDSVIKIGKYVDTFYKRNKDIYERHYFVEDTESVIAELSKSIPNDYKCNTSDDN